MAWWKICMIGGGYVLVVIVRRLLRKRRLCKCKDTLEGKTVVVTGANCGIGEATALELARRKARVILACRDLSAGENAIKNIRKQTTDGVLLVRHLDLSRLPSVREFAAWLQAEESKLDVLINNAGVYKCSYSKTEDGFETQMGVNHFGHFLLTNLLLDLLKKSVPSRIIVVSSSLHKNGHINFDDINSKKSYNKSQAYKDSKLANALFCRELSQRLEGSGVCVYCVHPGIVATNLSRHVLNPLVKRLLMPLFVLLGMKTAEEGCQTIIYCSVAPELQTVSGGYFGSCQQEPWSKAASDQGVARKLWEISERLTGLVSPGDC